MRGFTPHISFEVNMLEKGEVRGATAKGKSLYMWAGYGNLILFERAYSRTAMMDSLFRASSIPNLDRYSKLISYKGSEVPAFDFLMSKGVNPKVRSFILNFLSYQDTVYTLDTPTSFVIKLDNNLRGVIHLGKGNIPPS